MATAMATATATATAMAKATAMTLLKVMAMAMVTAMVMEDTTEGYGNGIVDDNNNGSDCIEGNGARSKRSKAMSAQWCR
jgi:hypothetical protein